MLRLLLVDDDRDGLHMRRLIFEREGYLVFSEGAADGARRTFAENSPEIVVLDLRLPQAEDGLALIREFREHSPCVRIIVLSGWTGALHGRPEAAMVDALFEKPVRSAKLVRAVAGIT
jgi:DNA-binding response OmpR family regulator